MPTADRFVAVSKKPFLSKANSPRKGPPKFTEGVARSPIVRSILKIGVGTGAAQVITLAAAPLLTRIYGPDGLGVQAAFMAAVGVLLPLAALRYPQAMVIARDEMEVRSIELASILMSLVVAALLLTTAIFHHNDIAGLFGIGGGSWIVFMLPLATLFIAYQEIMDARLVRLERFGAIGKIGAFQSIIVNGFRLGTGALYPYPGNLIVISTLSPALHAIMAHIGSGGKSKARAHVKGYRVGRTLKKYGDFPLYRLPADLIYAVSEAVPVFFLTVEFGAVEAGFYSIARTLLVIPNGLVGNAASSVLYARMASMDREQVSFLPLLRKYCAILLFGPGLLLVIVTLLAQPLFGPVLGPGWDGAGPIAAAVAIWMACNLGYAPATRAANVLKRQREVLVVDVIALVVRVGSLLVAVWLGAGAVGVVAAYSITSALRALFLTGLMLHFTRLHVARWQISD